MSAALGHKGRQLAVVRPVSRSLRAAALAAAAALAGCAELGRGVVSGPSAAGADEPSLDRIDAELLARSRGLVSAHPETFRVAGVFRCTRAGVAEHRRRDSC
ncbi:MAG: hypothetical protein HY744_05425 [Deltaproteobacteria bacterium]|nr:hypothetical protein [Deltaproteobacteria bacterium]